MGRHRDWSAAAALVPPALLGGLLVYVLLVLIPQVDAQDRNPLDQGARQPPITTAATQPPIVTVPGGVAPAPQPPVASQPAVAVTEVKSPAAPAHYTDQAIWALMVSLLMQYLKKTPWFGWITPESSSKLKAQFGFVAALVTAAGVHFAVSGSVLDGGGASITVSGLSLNAIKDVAWQWASQQAWYQAVVKDAPVPAAPRVVLGTSLLPTKEIV